MASDNKIKAIDRSNRNKSILLIEFYVIVSIAMRRSRKVEKGHYLVISISMNDMPSTKKRETKKKKRKCLIKL